MAARAKGGRGMKTYDELYDDIKRTVAKRFEDYKVDYWSDGAYHAFRYVLDRMEEIREKELEDGR